ncbi:hypothetical protein Sjap_007012 [Stephania japonica]|uniref:DNA (cytosine-5-)-methyltransferase n=1 Tax=Stephania japonica TaxID=461633 RepID=A0AAP0K8R8_9MAGN
MVVCVDSESSSDVDGEIKVKSEVEILDLDSCSATPNSRPNGESIASSSGSHLRSRFVAMGFSPALVDKVLDENGEGDEDSLLEAIFTYSAIQEPKPEPSDSIEEVFGDHKDVSSSSEFNLDDDDDGVEGLDVTSDVKPDKKTSLLKMNFSAEEVDFAMSKLGEETPFHEYVDFIMAAQIAQRAKKEEAFTESLFGTMDKTLRLFEMGFSGEEISSAIETCDEVSVEQLADSIFASRAGDTCVKDEQWVSTHDFLHYPNGENDWSSIRTNESSLKRPFSNGMSAVKTEVSTSDTDIKGKKPKLEHEDYISAYFGPSVPGRRYNGSIASEMKAPQPFGSNASGKTSYFLYGNVMEISQDTWARLSQFLYSTAPEIVNIQLFSALNRNEGYIHNLPTENRTHIHPRSPKTIEDVMPQARKWWPPWDARKQLSCISSDTRGVSQLCERLERILSNSRGMVSKEQQIDILHHCKTMNLMWVGNHKLGPLEPEHLEVILGYPLQHTRVSNSSLPERLRSLKFSFQTDALGYHLSPLKQLFPSGLTVLSLHSGIGGAEVALHRLGIHLNVVVAVEASEANQRMLKKWWQDTEQSGQLVQIDDTKRLTSNKLKKLMEEFGGFDLIVGQNPCTDANSNLKSSFDDEDSAGLDFTLFFEFVRVASAVSRYREVSGFQRYDVDGTPFGAKTLDQVKERWRDKVAVLKLMAAIDLKGWQAATVTTLSSEA